MRIEISTMSGSISNYFVITDKVLINMREKWSNLIFLGGMGLVNATNGNISAKYEYGPFGEVFCSVGDMAKVNPFGFSTKYTDNETDLVYYGYRYYSPALGRWMNRDPIEEKGGLNLYGFVNNDPVNRWDKLGLRSLFFGAGQLCVKGKCNKEQLDLLKYIPEDPPYNLKSLPQYGCVDADALYMPGEAYKIPDNGKITVQCNEKGCLSSFNFFRWPWWLKDWVIWKKGEGKPEKWPGDVKPY
ncbi:MAG: RHS repeat-associated core domain-containing protein [Parabacteroides sp.]|nr:RHS repeat-associated core domain-containing protein [Parabacteroides sp.]